MPLEMVNIYRKNINPPVMIAKTTSIFLPMKKLLSAELSVSAETFAAYLFKRIRRHSKNIIFGKKLNIIRSFNELLKFLMQ